VYKYNPNWKRIIKNETLDQWGVCTTPKVMRPDRMNIKPQEENNEESNKTYPQDWSAYNQAQTQEKILFF
jgi:hypothetical protein